MPIRIIMSVVTFALVITSCNSKTDKNSSSVDSVDNVVKTQYLDGTPRTEISYKNGKKNGKSKQYHQTGKIFEEIDYKNGLKQGLSRKYYEDGVILQETPYDSNRIHGIQKNYRKDGKLSAEVPYFKGNQCVGLKEYYLDGALKEEYPSIVIRPEDYLISQEEYRLILTMSENVKEVTYYEGNLTDDKYIGQDTKEIKSTEDQPGQGQLSFFVTPGESLKKVVNIIAKFKTVQGNYYITQRMYSLSVRNR